MLLLVVSIQFEMGFTSACPFCETYTLIIAEPQGKTPRPTPFSKRNSREDSTDVSYLGIHPFCKVSLLRPYSRHAATLHEAFYQSTVDILAKYRSHTAVTVYISGEHLINNRDLARTLLRIPFSTITTTNP